MIIRLGLSYASLCDEPYKSTDLRGNSLHLSAILPALGLRPRRSRSATVPMRRDRWSHGWLGKPVSLPKTARCELVRTRTTIGVMALLSGELDFIQASGPVVIESTSQGSDLVYIAGGMATLDFIFMSQPEIKTAEMLKGRSRRTCVDSRRIVGGHGIRSGKTWFEIQGR